MEIKLEGQNIDITPALKELAQKKLQRLEHLGYSIKQVHVVLKIDKHEQIADGNLKMDGAAINARAESEDMYKSIDLLAEKLMTQLRKYKEKHLGHQS